MVRTRASKGATILQEITRTVIAVVGQDLASGQAMGEENAAGSVTERPERGTSAGLEWRVRRSAATQGLSAGARRRCAARHGRERWKAKRSPKSRSHYRRKRNQEGLKDEAGRITRAGGESRSELGRGGVAGCFRRKGCGAHKVATRGKAFHHPYLF
jgi:hypothetical protein